MTRDADHARLSRAIAGRRLPCVVVDLGALDRNLGRALAPVVARGKRLRIATKSVRVAALLRRLLERAGPSAAGLMAYAAGEVAWLRERGFDDLLLAYPTARAEDAAALARAAAGGGDVKVVVDAEAHLDALARAAKEVGASEARRPRVVIDLDVSYRPLGALHLGARRSPLRTPEAAVTLARAARARGLEVAGLMAYEAHVAGLPDASPFARARNPLHRLFKRVAAPAAARLRGEVVLALRAAGFALPLVNGGGSGSLETTAADPSVTEVAAGSAFLAPHLFGYFRSLALEPACFFACAVARAPDPGIVTCHGGGWVASGAAGRDRLPLPWLPEGLALLDAEGAGEVQTPLDARACRLPLAPGDAVFFRHAKAGEVMEHANEVMLVEGDRVVEVARTYRGEGCDWL